MKLYYIEQTENTPEVNLNPETGIFEIKGISRPENVHDFYGQIIIWLDDFLNEKIIENKAFGIKITLTLFLEYFNSSSTKYVFSILKKMAEFKAAGVSLTVNWIYENGDEDMIEVGEEMQKLIKIPFVFNVV